MQQLEDNKNTLKDEIAWGLFNGDMELQGLSSIAAVTIGFNASRRGFLRIYIAPFLIVFILLHSQGPACALASISHKQLHALLAGSSVESHRNAITS